MLTIKYWKNNEFVPFGNNQFRKESLKDAKTSEYKCDKK